MKKFLDTTGLQILWGHILNKLNGKVDKVDGKGLSTNDFTTAEKTKLAGIAANATANTGDITGVTAGSGLTGGGSSGSVTLNVGAGSGITVAADAVSVNTGYTTSGKNYKVAVDSSSGGLYVNVPWTDNNTWKANSSSSEGYVASGSGQANKVWKTNADGVPAWRTDANTTYSAATSSTAGLMSAADKAKLDGIAAGATATTITGITAGSGLTGGGSSGSVTLNVGAGTGITVAADTVAAKLRSATALTVDSAAATTTSGRVYPVAVDKTGYLAVNVPWTDTNTTYTLGSFGITATAAELNKLDGVTATATELNYVDGVTSNIQTQLNNKVGLSTQTATLASGKTSWTVSVSGVTASNTVIVTPAPASYTAYHAAGIYCSAQAAGSLTFKSTEATSAALTVQILILT